MKALIVGAGPTGLTVAVELARRGISPTIVDRRDGASTLSRAVGITPRSLELLSHSGASKELIAEGIAMDGLRVYHGTKLNLEMQLKSQTAYHPNLVCLPQDRTEAIIAETLSRLGTEIAYGMTCENFTEELDGVVVQFGDGKEEKYDHVIGADGIRSTVRETAGIAYPGFDLAERWSVADVDLATWRHPGCLTVFQAGPGKVAVVVPIGEGRYRVVATGEKALDTMPIPLDVTNIRREGAFKISVRKAETYSTGRVHLAGDAAHAHSPVGGRGMNLGIADAAELAKRLIEGGLAGYSEARHGDALEARKITERGRKMSTGPNLFRRVAFRGLVAAAGHLPGIQRRLGQFIVEF